MKPFTIRPGEEKDLGSIEKLLVEIHALHHSIHPEIFTGADVPKYGIPELGDLLKRGDCFIRVASDGDKVLGYIIAFLVKEEGNRAVNPLSYLYIDDLCVDASCRKLGVGRSLMEEAEKIAKGLGLSSVRLNVYAGNDAEAFYDRAGYKTLKRILEKRID